MASNSESTPLVRRLVGNSRVQGSITKTGNTPVRRLHARWVEFIQRRKRPKGAAPECSASSLSLVFRSTSGAIGTTGVSDSAYLPKLVAGAGRTEESPSLRSGHPPIASSMGGRRSVARAVRLLGTHRQLP